MQRGEVLKLADFLRPLRKALVKGDVFNLRKLEGKMFQWWMPSQTFITTVANNSLGQHTLEELGRALSAGQLPPSKEYEEDAHCPRTLLPVAQGLWIKEEETAYYFFRLNPWLRISAPRGDAAHWKTQ